MWKNPFRKFGHIYCPHSGSLITFLVAFYRVFVLEVVLVVFAGQHFVCLGRIIGIEKSVYE